MNVSLEICMTSVLSRIFHFASQNSTFISRLVPPPPPILLHARGQTLLILLLLRHSLRENLQLLQNNMLRFNGENCESSGLIRLQ